MVQSAVDQYAFAVRITDSFIVGKSYDRSIIIQSVEHAVDEDITVVFFAVSDPHESTLAIQCRILKESWSST